MTTTVDPALVMDSSDEDAGPKLQNAYTLWVFMNNRANDGWKPK